MPSTLLTELVPQAPQWLLLSPSTRSLGTHQSSVSAHHLSGYLVCFFVMTFKKTNKQDTDVLGFCGQRCMFVLIGLVSEALKANTRLQDCISRLCGVFSVVWFLFVCLLVFGFFFGLVWCLIQGLIVLPTPASLLELHPPQ